jgi:hypothetical protein
MARIKLPDISSMPATEPARAHGWTKVEKGPAAGFICEAITVAAYDELPYMFELERGEILEFTLRSDVPVDVLLCDSSDYDRWLDSGYDAEIAFSVHLEAEDVLAYTLRFTASTKGEYAVLLMNWTECPADIVVEIPDWLNRALL